MGSSWLAASVDHQPSFPPKRRPYRYRPLAHLHGSHRVGHSDGRLRFRAWRTGADQIQMMQETLRCWRISVDGEINEDQTRFVEGYLRVRRKSISHRPQVL